MKKINNKVFKIILSIVLALLGIGLVVFYVIDPTSAKSLLKKAISVLNQPLPIVGITVGALLIFIWRLIISLNYGKKTLETYNSKLLEIEQAKKEFFENANAKINELEQDNQALRSQLSAACELSTNKKIKDFGKGLLEYGKETSNSETKAE